MKKITVGKDLTDLIARNLVSAEKKAMKDSLNYYAGKHDILNYKMYYFDSNGQLREEKTRSNIKIPHRFYTQLIDQKIGYLLSNPVEITSKNERLNNRLKQYITSDFQAMLYELTEGASLKGWETVYFYFDKQGLIHFDVVDSFNLFYLKDEKGEIAQIVRYYSITTVKDGKTVKIEKAEVFDNEKVTYFIKKGKEYKLDDAKELNPKPHKMLKSNGRLYVAKDNRLPFLILQNNKQASNDLSAIKELIDDYDKMASGLSNNLIDFDQPIYLVKGADGDDLDSLVHNLKARKSIGVSDDGAIDIKTVDIPFEARVEKLNITRKAIYEFGMGFDSTSVGSEGAQLTNIGIKSMYSLLDMKCNKAEVKLKAILSQIVSLILANIAEVYSEQYEQHEVDIVIKRSQMTNNKELAEEEQIKANAHLTRVNAILASAMQLDAETVVKLLADEFDLEADDLIKALHEQSALGLGLDNGEVE
ncbi:phage portal protein [Aerococcaceae bacterium NML160702]|nr:phage portal protein [Aerococcaceae bacterium NML160702]